MTETPPKTVLVTGTNRGLGRSVAREFLEHGFKVTSLNRTLCNEAWLGEIPCDLEDRGQVRAAAAQVRARGALDVCVLNAAVRHFSPIESMTDKQWDQSLAVNLTAPLVLLRELWPALASARGRFIVIGSHAGSHPFEGGAAYCATKAALKAVVEVCLLEARALGIRAMLVSPGAVRNRPMPGDGYKMRPESVAKVVRQLADAPADVVVGEVELRPSAPPASPVVGIDRLQYI